MPTISVDPVDFKELLGQDLTPEQIEAQLDLVKAEYKGLDEEGCYRIELNDTNRPDLWSAEGIARQLRTAQGRRRDYPFFSGEAQAEILVDPSVEGIRPVVAAFIVRGLPVSERSLAQIIQTQEKLAENYGRKRRDVAIGVYNLAKIKFPVHYRAVDPKSHSYVPLGFEEPMDLADILERHPKGIQYRSILAGLDRVPLLTDDADLTLSLPPVINSRELGEVMPGDSELFVEATGFEFPKVLLALNIMACDMADRGGRIERVRTVFPAETVFGTKVDVPRKLDLALTVDLDEFSRLLGVSVNRVEADSVLERYGCDVHMEGDQVTVEPPPYRADYLHPVDVVEDFAIARGYETFEPKMPQDFTPGRSLPVSVLEDKVRDQMIGMGYEELISNILFNRDLLRHRMNLGDAPLVHIANVMNENYSALRDAILPCLLLAESRSATAAYPHRLFEVGDVARFNLDSPVGSDTLMSHAGLVVHREANLSEVHADLEYLFHMLSVDWQLEEAQHPSYLPGRCARIVAAEHKVGWLGEVHPEVLSRWEIGMPAAAYEFTLDELV